MEVKKEQVVLQFGCNDNIVPMDPDQTELMMNLMFLEMDKPDVSLPDDMIGFLGQVVRKRIEAFSLPIKFTDIGLAAINCYCKSPGDAVFMLIDILNKFHNSNTNNKIINLERLASPELYPNGFYKKEWLYKFIDENVKTRKVMYSEIY